MRLSIVTPTLNIGHWLPECLDSVSSQAKHAEFIEQIVVDGGSRDSSVEIATAHGARVVQVDRAGLYFQLNVGLSVAEGDVIGYLGGDDILLPGAVKVVDDWYRSGRNPILIGGIRWTDLDGKTRGDLAAPPTWMTSEMFASLGWNCMQHTSAFVRKDLMVDLGGFDETYDYCGDYEFFARALRKVRFDRSRHSLSAWRMQGIEPSPEKARGTEEENRRILEAYAPASGARRQAYRTGLKVWLNGRSFRWFAAKKVPALRPLLFREQSTPRE